jgi:hypothetical protein
LLRAVTGVGSVIVDVIGVVVGVVLVVGRCGSLPAGVVFGAFVGFHMIQ